MKLSKFLLPPFLTKVAEDVQDDDDDPSTGSDLNPTVQISVLARNIYQADVPLIRISDFSVLAGAL